MTTHELKIWPEFFEAVVDGRKTFEVREDHGRNFVVGDLVKLNEWVPVGPGEGFTGRSITRRITYIQDNLSPPRLLDSNDVVILALGSLLDDATKPPGLASVNPTWFLQALVVAVKQSVPDAVIARLDERVPNVEHLRATVKDLRADRDRQAEHARDVERKCEQKIMSARRQRDEALERAALAPVALHDLLIACSEALEDPELTIDALPSKLRTLRKADRDAAANELLLRKLSEAAQLESAEQRRNAAAMRQEIDRLVAALQGMREARDSCLRAAEANGRDVERLTKMLDDPEAWMQAVVHIGRVLHDVLDEPLSAIDTPRDVVLAVKRAAEALRGDDAAEANARFMRAVCASMSHDGTAGDPKVLVEILRGEVKHTALTDSIEDEWRRRLDAMQGRVKRAEADLATARQEAHEQRSRAVQLECLYTELKTERDELHLLRDRLDDAENVLHGIAECDDKMALRYFERYGVDLAERKR